MTSKTYTLDQIADLLAAVQAGEMTSEEMLEAVKAIEPAGPELTITVVEPEGDDPAAGEPDLGPCPGCDDGQAPRRSYGYACAVCHAEVEADEAAPVAAPVEEAQEVTVLACRAEEAVEALGKLARKAARYGCPGIEWTVGEVFTVTRTGEDYDGSPYEYEEAYRTITVTGAAPVVGPYEFIASLERSEGGVLVNVRPGCEIPVRYREADGSCDHCGTARRRNHVFVVRNLETGEHMQVGRSCLRDFMGTDDPARVLRRFDLYKKIGALGEEFDRWEAPQWRRQTLLALTARVIDAEGWKSRTSAREWGGTATADIVCRLLDKARDSRKTLGLTDAEWAEAEAVMQWAAALEPGESTYLHNLQVALAEGVVRYAGSVGLICSAVQARRRALAQEAKEVAAERSPSVHVGAVGERLRDLALTVAAVNSWDTAWGTTYLYSFQDDAGNVLKWFASRPEYVPGEDRDEQLRPGAKVIVTGTVKAHEEYKNAAETVLTRCKVTVSENGPR